MDKLIELLTTHYTYDETLSMFTTYNQISHDGNNVSVWRHLANAINNYDMFLELVTNNPKVFIDAIKDIETRARPESVTVIGVPQVELCIIASQITVMDLHVVYMVSTNSHAILQVNLEPHIVRFRYLNDLLKYTDETYPDSDNIVGYHGNDDGQLFLHLAAMLTPNARLIRKFNAANRHIIEMMSKKFTPI